MPQTTRIFRTHAIWPLVASVFLHVLLFHPNLDTRDTERFFEQARGILAGQGPTWQGAVDLSLPVGYPLFLAGFLSLGIPDIAIRCAQVALSILSCCLVYLAIRPYSHRWAYRSLWILGTCPWMVQRSGVLLSEALGVFCCACFIFTYSLADRRPTGWAMLLLGIHAALLPLVSPFAVFLAAAGLVYVAIRHIARPRIVAAAVAGGLCIFAPWSTFVLRTITHQDGGFNLLQGAASVTVPSAYESVRAVLKGRRDSSPESQAILGAFNYERFKQDVVVYESDLKMFFHVPSDNFQIAYIPDRAFLSELQRQDAQQRVDEFFAGKRSRSDLNAYFGILRDERMRLRWWQIRALYPILRSINLWTDMHMGVRAFRVTREDLPWNHQSPPFGSPMPSRINTPTIGDIGRAIYSGAFFLLYVAYPIGFILAAARALVARRWQVLPLFMGVLAYTSYCAFMACPEARRNIVFFPAMMFVAAYLPSRGRNECLPQP